MKIPHLVQYQGSKRNLSEKIVKFFPKEFNRLVEPFSGSAAISIACAFYKYTDKFLINDLNAALLRLFELVVNKPDYVCKEYKILWQKQHSEPMEYYRKIRDEFNKSKDPIKFLYLLARCVKGSVRYNANNEFNQSPDKRRLGTSPENMEKNVFHISYLLKNKCEFRNENYVEILRDTKKGDLVYMDPPYQGVCGNKDSRYYAGIDFKEFVEEIENLNKREIDYVISYDGKCGSKEYGEKLPERLGLKRFLITAGRSSQSTLLGRNHQTIESLYVSNKFIVPFWEKNPALLARCFN